jgi:hypothetical protein
MLSLVMGREIVIDRGRRDVYIRLHS